MKSDIARLDRLLEHRVRLAVCVLLSRDERLSFSKLKQLTEETDGNLGANLKKLEDAGYVTVTKEFVERKPVSWYAISPGGRKALRSHLEGLQKLIAQAGKPPRGVSG